MNAEEKLFEEVCPDVVRAVRYVRETPFVEIGVKTRGTVVEGEVEFEGGWMDADGEGY